MGDAELVVRARAGDELAFRRLLDRHRDTIHFAGAKYFGPGLDRDDFESEALHGFHKAVRDFDPERGVRFGSFAKGCVERQVITTLKTAQRKKHEALNGATSLSAPVADDPNTTLGEVLTDRRSSSPDPVERVLLAEEIRELGAALRERLTELECAVLVHWAGGEEYEAIASALDVTTKTIDNALQRAHRKLGAEAPPASTSGQFRAYGYRCPSCGGPTVRLRSGAGRSPRCVVCRVRGSRFSADLPVAEAAI